MGAHCSLKAGVLVVPIPLLLSLHVRGALLHLSDPPGISALQQPCSQQGRASLLPKHRALRAGRCSWYLTVAQAGLVLLQGGAGGSVGHVALQKDISHTLGSRGGLVLSCAKEWFGYNRPILDLRAPSPVLCPLGSHGASGWGQGQPEHPRPVALAGPPSIMFSGPGAWCLGFAGEMLLAVGASSRAQHASHAPVSPSAPPATTTVAADCSLPRLLPPGVQQHRLPTLSNGPRRVGAGRELGKSFPPKQDPYLAAACVGRPRAEGQVPPPWGLARLQRGGTRVLPAERWGCPAAGRAHATQLCPQPSVRLSRNEAHYRGGQ